MFIQLRKPYLPLLNISYPSNQIYSLKGSMTFAYEGDRNRDDIVAFAKRLLGKLVVIYMVDTIHLGILLD